MDTDPEPSLRSSISNLFVLSRSNSPLLIGVGVLLRRGGRTVAV